MNKLVPAALLLLAACAGAPPAEPPVPAAVVVTLDESDTAILDRTLQVAGARPAGEAQRWENPSNGKTGSLTMIRQGFTRDGRHCGEVHLDARLHGYRAQDVRTACVGPDGRWQPEGGFSVAG